MVKKLYVLISLLLLFFLISPFSVLAQQQTERWVCLQAVHCWAKKPESAACVVKSGHRARLTTDPSAKPLPSKETYIVECVATNNGQICTTGDPITDNIIYKQNNVALLQTAINYQKLGMYGSDGVTVAANPTTSNPSGDIGPFEWASSGTQAVRKFMALNYWTPINSQAVQGGAGALQQGSVDFDFEAAEKDCIGIAWDPFGRVFDAKSLEPVKGMSVSLSKKRDDGSFTWMTTSDIVGGNIINPQTTKEDGVFSFIVPDGIYKLSVAGANYTFPVSDLSSIHANYTKAYSNIYPAEVGEEINQAGKLEQRDIALQPAGTPANNPPKLMEYFYEAKPITQKITVEGIVSHPLTKLIFYSDKMSTTDTSTPVRYRQLGEIQADKYGKFKYEINQSKFEPDEFFGEVDLSKVDLTLLTKENKSFMKKILVRIDSLIKKVSAQSISATTIKFTPIPTYLDGYAYDTAGKPMAETKVGIYLNFSNKPYFETKTDSQGYFKITSEELPRTAYGLRYTSPTGVVVKATTSEFIAQNKDYLAKNKIGLYVYKNQQGKVLTKTSLIPTQLPTLVKQTTASNAAAQPMVLVLIGFLVLLLIGAIIVFISLAKKKKQEFPTSLNPPDNNPPTSI